MATYQITVEVYSDTLDKERDYIGDTLSPAFEVNYLPLRTANTNTALSRAAILKVKKLKVKQGCSKPEKKKRGTF